MGSLTSEESKRINDIAIGVATGVTASVAAGIAIDVLCGILTTNYENKTIAGDVVMKPTKQETDLQMQPNSRLMRIPQMLLLQI